VRNCFFFQITQEKNNDAIDEEDDDMDYDDPETGDFPKILHSIFKLCLSLFLVKNPLENHFELKRA